MKRDHEREAQVGLHYAVSIVLLLLVGVLGVLLLIEKAHGRDLTGQYANSPDHEWISTRHNKQGTPCCDIADGTRLEDVDWKSDGESYSVRIDGSWVRVPSDKVLTEPNKLGQAMVWIWHGTIMCFIPGAGI